MLTFILVFIIVLLAIYMIRNPLNNDGALMQLHDYTPLPKRQMVRNTHWYQHTLNRPRRK